VRRADSRVARLVKDFDDGSHSVKERKGENGEKEAGGEGEE
jgi:hypothetical protein